MHLEYNIRANVKYSIQYCTVLTERCKTQVSVKVQHIFSVEVDAKKRDFILSAHGFDKTMHLFGDVEIFASPDRPHYCYSCQCEHKVPDACDVLASGPSCKMISKMFRDRKQYVGSFLAPLQLVRTVRNILE